MENLACGCPGSHVQTIDRPRSDHAPAQCRAPSELRQWPTQLKLVPPSAPWLQGADLLIAADCGPFAYANYHRDFIRGRVLVNACPKLDESGPYVEKLTEMFRQNEIKSVTVAIMEVPCCRGLEVIVRQALAASGKDVPMTVAVIGVDGERRQ